MDWRRGQKSKGRRWHPGTLLEMRGASICHRQPPPLAVEDSPAQQLGGSPNTLGITLQQQHLFSQEQEAGGDASFYSFYAVLHHTKSSRDHLAQRITPCHKSLIPLKRAATLEEMVAHVSCIYCNASSWALMLGPHTEPGSQAAPAKLHTPPATCLARQAKQQWWLWDDSLAMADTLAQSWEPHKGLGRDGHTDVAQCVQAHFYKVLRRK